MLQENKVAKILVTGAAGLVGAGICNYMRDKGHIVIGTVRQKSQATNQQNICIDLSEPELDLSNYFSNIDGVVHTAAVVPNSGSNANDEKNKNKTILIDKNVANFCTQQGVPVVYISSCGFYDLSKPEIKNEKSAIIEASPYHVAKILGEQCFMETSRAIVARISSPYGSEVMAETVLKLFLYKAFRNETIAIWGSGKREQDFIHVKDIAHFAELALFSGETGIFNVTQGSQIQMIDLAELCINVCKSGYIERVAREDPAEKSYPRFSIKRAQNILNWSPKITLEKGLADIIEKWK